jgi:hypothetical protein
MNKSPPADGQSKKLPPFIKHFKSSNTNGSTVYKVRDSKTWNNTTWYFCDCPTHRDKHKWHTHPTDTCRTRQKWKEGRSSSPAIANMGQADQADESDPDDAPAPAPSPDITAFLASALNLAGANDAARELIAEALNAVHDF